MEGKAQYYVLKGMVSEMNKEDQEKIENIKDDILSLVLSDPLGSIALSLAAFQIMFEGEKDGNN